MELTVPQVAVFVDIDAQLVRRALRDGYLAAVRQVGNTTVVDDIAAIAWSRAVARGRTWAPRVREAALDLLSGTKDDELGYDERSRLRARLRTMTAARLAHAAGGLGGTWSRYTAKETDLGEPIGPDAADVTKLGIVPGNTDISFVRVDDLDDLELRHDVTLDANGNLCVVERPADKRIARILLDTYLLGTRRESAAAAAELERLCHAA